MIIVMLKNRFNLAYSYLMWRPRVQVDGFDLGDVNSQVAVDSGTADAHEDAQVPGGPPWP